MAKGSLTALQSVVSLMSMNRLRTVMTVRLNTVGCEKLFLPISIILLCAASIAFTAAALGTPGWVEVSSDAHPASYAHPALQFACRIVS